MGKKRIIAKSEDELIKETEEREVAQKKAVNKLAKKGNSPTGGKRRIRC